MNAHRHVRHLRGVGASPTRPVTDEPEPFPSAVRPYGHHDTVEPPHHEYIRTATLAALRTRCRPCC